MAGKEFRDDRLDPRDKVEQMNPAHNCAYIVTWKGYALTNHPALDGLITHLQRWAQAVARCCPNRSYLVDNLMCWKDFEPSNPFTLGIPHIAPVRAAFQLWANTKAFP